MKIGSSKMLRYVVVAGLATLIHANSVSALDCNNNGIEDAIDIADGTSLDCQPDGVPDECQTPTGVCGDGVADCLLGEACDGGDDADCPGLCRPDCACREQWLYWIEEDGGTHFPPLDRIMRARVADPRREELVAGLRNARDLVIDLSNRKLMWANSWQNQILRSNLDGSAVEVIQSTPNPKGISIDAVNGHVYWTQSGGAGSSGFIHRANLDGSQPVVLLDDPASRRIGSIVVNASEGKMYWWVTLCTESCDTDVIRSAALDGTGITDILTNLVPPPASLAIDPVGRKIYWGTSENIQRSNLDGSDIEDVIAPVFPFMDVDCLLVDHEAGKLYWCRNTVSRGIYSANLDGTNTELLTIVNESANGIALHTTCELLPGDSDCQPNGIPDNCDPDCDGNGVPDDCELTSGAPDCQSNGIPDSCETDCNLNAVPDDCDIANGTPDENGNGIPDECDAAPGAGDGIPKSRYVTIEMPAPEPRSIQVTILEMPQFPEREGDVWWVGPEVSIPNAPNPSLRGAQLECTTTPHSQVWTDGFLHFFGTAIVPGSKYEVRTCLPDGSGCSAPLVVETGNWGDAKAPFGGGGQPDFGDIAAIVAKFENEATAPDMVSCDLRGLTKPGLPNLVDGVAGFADAGMAVGAFEGNPFPFTVGACP